MIQPFENSKIKRDKDNPSVGVWHEEKPKLSTSLTFDFEPQLFAVFYFVVPFFFGWIAFWAAGYPSFSYFLGGGLVGYVFVFALVFSHYGYHISTWKKLTHYEPPHKVIPHFTEWEVGDEIVVSRNDLELEYKGTLDNHLMVFKTNQITAFDFTYLQLPARALQDAAINPRVRRLALLGKVKDEGLMAELERSQYMHFIEAYTALNAKDSKDEI